MTQSSPAGFKSDLPELRKVYDFRPNFFGHLLVGLAELTSCTELLLRLRRPRRLHSQRCRLNIYSKTPHEFCIVFFRVNEVL
jgi:hypothetical protein